MDRIIPVADAEISKTFHRILSKSGMKIYTGHKVTGGKNNGDHAEITFEPVADSTKSKTIKCDHVLVATGRVPYTNGLGASQLGIKFDDKKRIVVNENF